MSMSSTKKRIGVAVAAASIVAGGEATVAFAATAPVAGATSVTAATHHHRARGILRHTDYATVEVRQHKQWVTVTLNRGTVTSVSGTSITLLRPDGQSATIALSATTHYRGLPTSATTVQTGKRAAVISQNGTARMVFEAKPGSDPNGLKATPPVAGATTPTA